MQFVAFLISFSVQLVFILVLTNQEKYFGFKGAHTHTHTPFKLIHRMTCIKFHKVKAVLQKWLLRKQLSTSSDEVEGVRLLSTDFRENFLRLCFRVFVRIYMKRNATNKLSPQTKSFKNIIKLAIFTGSQQPKKIDPFH